MPTVTVRFNNKQYEELKKHCDKEGIAISSYIKELIFPQENVKENFLTNEIITKKIREKISKKELNEEFVLSELFEDAEYIQYYNFIPAGKTFFKYASTPGTDAYNLVEALGGKPAKYRIK